MTNYADEFVAEIETLATDVDHVTEMFYLAIVDKAQRLLNDHRENGSGPSNRSELAEAMGATPARVSDIFRGRRTNVQLRTIVELAVALKVDPHELCARRKTDEMMRRPLMGLPGYGEVQIAVEKRTPNAKRSAGTRA